MATKHHISHASKLYYGDAYDPILHASNDRFGVEFTPVIKVAMGSPVTLDADGLMTGATSTELPNNGTKTYTWATDGTSPLDNSATPASANVVMANGETALVVALDVPRNITVATSAAAADTVVTITGYDVYKQKMVETITVASGASSGAGVKAFKYVEIMSIYSAGDITSDTLTIGWGDVLGLPYKVTAKSDIMQAWFNGVYETTAPTVVVGDATTATATTGDVRGTIDTNSAMNGSAVVLYMTVNPDTRETLLGTAHYAG